MIQQRIVTEQDFFSCLLKCRKKTFIWILIGMKNKKFQVLGSPSLILHEQ